MTRGPAIDRPGRRRRKSWLADEPSVRVDRQFAAAELDSARPKVVQSGAGARSCGVPSVPDRSIRQQSYVPRAVDRREEALGGCCRSHAGPRPASGFSRHSSATEPAERGGAQLQTRTSEGRKVRTPKAEPSSARMHSQPKTSGSSPVRPMSDLRSAVLFRGCRRPRDRASASSRSQEQEDTPISTSCRASLAPGLRLTGRRRRCGRKVRAARGRCSARRQGTARSPKKSWFGQRVTAGTAESVECGKKRFSGRFSSGLDAASSMWFRAVRLQTR